MAADGYWLSDCCGWYLYIASGNEGTCCEWCKQPCRSHFAPGQPLPPWRR